VLAREAPQCRSVILTTFGRPGYLRRAMESGASGFVLKDSPPDQLSGAIAKTGTRNRSEAIRLAEERGCFSVAAAIIGAAGG
jgi:two-component system response regulator DesR